MTIGAAVLGVVLLGAVVAMIVWSLRKPNDVAGDKSATNPTPPSGMAYVAGNEFTMGNDAGDESERPQHKVTVKPFFIDINEVTCEEYEKFIRATSRQPPATWANGYPSGWERRPVTGVNWDDASAYAEWADKRLPTEQEWELAARGSDGRLYPWGTEWKDGLANAGPTSLGHVVDVGRYPAGVSPFGAVDMVGNAWEWTASDLVAYPGGRLPGPATGALKVIRGGCYLSRPNQATVTIRVGWPARGGDEYDNTSNNASDFWVIVRKGTEKADRELANVSVEFRITPNGTAAEQKRIVNDLLSGGIDGIAISPVDPTNQTPFINETARQTLVFTQDSDAPQSDRTAFVGSSNVAAGRQAGALIKEALPDGGKVMLFVGRKDAQNARERYQGIQEALQGSMVEIIDVRTDGVDRARAKSNVADTLAKYPDIKGLVGLWSYNGPAILNAATEAGKLYQVKIICFDEEEQTLAGLKAGTIFGTVVQQPFEFGYQAIRMMAQVLRGDRSGIPENKWVIVPTLIIKKDNVEEFRRKLQEQRQ